MSASLLAITMVVALYEWLAVMSVSLQKLFGLGATAATRPWFSDLYLWLLLSATSFIFTRAFIFFRRQGFERQTRHLDRWVELIFVASLIWRFAFLRQNSLWLDEFSQAHWSALRFPVWAGAIEHQMPLDYALSGWAQMTGGQTEWSIRWQVALASALSIALLFRLLARASRSVGCALALTFSFATTTTVIRYSVESRPISLGLLHAIVFLSLVFEALDVITESSVTEPASEEAVRYLSWLIFAAALVFLISVGFQPPFLVAGVAIWVLLVCYLHSAQTREPAIREQISKGKNRLLVSFASAALCFLPIQCIVIKVAPHRFRNLNFTNLAAPLVSDTIGVLSAALSNLKFWLWLSLFMFVFAVFSARHRADQKAIIKNLTSVLVAFLITAIALSVVFTCIIDWNFEAHYVAVLIPFAAVFCALCFRAITESQARPTRAFIGLLSFVVSVVALVTLQTGFEDFRLRPPSPAEKGTPDVRAGFDCLRQRARASDMIVDLAVSRTRSWVPETFYGLEFYYPITLSDRASVARVDEKTVDWLNKISRAQFQPKRIFVYFEDYWSDAAAIKKVESDYQRETVCRSFGVRVLQLSNSSSNWKQSLGRLARDLTQAVPEFGSSAIFKAMSAE